MNTAIATQPAADRVSKKGSRPRLAYYSSIPCEPSCGGPLQIYRHFKERDDFEFVDLNGPVSTVWDDWIGPRVSSSRAFKRILSTRLYPWLLAMAFLTLRRRATAKLVHRVKESGAEALVTVAYGRRCLIARDAAKALNMPLITIFHDWWPDLVPAKTIRTLKWLDHCFCKLARDSDLILPVSDALLKELGGHSHAVTLPPIPSMMTFGAWDSTAPRHPDGEKLLVYAGTLQGPYGQMVRELGLEFLRKRPVGWNLRVYGPADDWPQEALLALSNSGVYGGCLRQGSELDSALSEADALLVVMDFEAANRRRVQTSFPSKILDYAPFGKPMIVWGPEECFASRFAREHELGWVVDQDDPQAVAGLLADGWPAAQAEAFGRAMQTLCRGSHSAEAVHRILVHSIQSLPGMLLAAAGKS